jgi:uncharacterized membrane protein
MLTVKRFFTITFCMLTFLFFRKMDRCAMERGQRFVQLIAFATVDVQK